MRKALMTVLCVVGVLLWGISTASAQVTWTLVEDASVTGQGPGGDKLVGTGDDTADNCNFLPTTSPCATGTPTIGTYSINIVDFKPDPREECYSGLVTGGIPCKCNDGTTTCHPGPETCPAIPGGCGETPGDCCGFLPCQTCDDAVSFMGSGNNSGTLVTVMGASNFSATVFDVGTTELIGGSGGGCLGLDTPGDDIGTPCPTFGTQTPVSGVLDVDVSVGGCSLPGVFQVANVNYVGNVFPALTPPANVCGYSGTPLANLISAAQAAAGTSNPSIMVLCGQTTLPATGGISSLPCYSNAQVDFRVIAYTNSSWTCP